MTTQLFTHESEMPASAAAAFAWHERPGAFERLNPPWDPVKVLQRDPSLAVGAKTVVQMHIAAVPVKWIANRLQMGTWTYLNNRLYWERRANR